VATQKTSPLDATGKAAEDAAKRNAEELKKRENEISLSRQAEQELLETAVFDPKNPDQPILIDEIEEVGVALNNDKVIVRTITDIDDMTYGVVNGTPQSYTFKSGVKYSVPRDLAEYLEGLGYIWRPN
jgi:Icc-related predicted phosphoesterase